MSDWNREDERWDDPRVIRQIHPAGCGSACAAMLLADRGITMDLRIIATKLSEPCMANELAVRLKQCSPPRHRWLGGHLNRDPPLLPEHLRASDATGSWAALLSPYGATVGHWIVIDNAFEEPIRVRDPRGSSYRMLWNELARWMPSMGLVIETKP